MSEAAHAGPLSSRWSLAASRLPLNMKQPFKLDYLWASLCILGAVYFVFRD
jgi:hypothetical protein